MIDKTNYSIQQVGTGKYTAVYSMELESNKMVALKVLKKKYEHEKVFKDLLVKEAKLGIQINHPNVRKVIELQRNEDDTWQVLLEYLDGYDMQQYIDNFGKIPENQVIDWLKKILPAIEEAHTKQIIHGQIKPGNLFINHKGTLKIMDFKGPLYESDLFPVDVDAEDILFLSPEQIQRKPQISYTNDIYSLGVTIFFLLSGRNPYDLVRNDINEVRIKILNESLPFIENISLKLNGIIQSCTAKDPNERFQSIEDIVAELVGKPAVKKSQLPEPDLFTELETETVESKNIAHSNHASNLKNGVHKDEPALENQERKAVKVIGPTLSDLSTNNEEQPDQESSESNASLEERAQAVWAKLGISQGEMKEPVVKKISVIKDISEVKIDTPKKKREEEPKKTITNNEGKGVTDFNSGHGRSESKIDEAQTSENETHKITPTTKPTGASISDEKPVTGKSVEVIEIPDNNSGTLTPSAVRRKSNWIPWTLAFLALAGIGFAAYFFRTDLFPKPEIIVDNSAIVTPTDSQVVTNNIDPANSEISAAVMDSLIVSDSTSLNLEKLEAEKLAKLKELELEKKKQEELKKKAALESSIDRSKTEIIGDYIGDIAPFKYNGLIGFINQNGTIAVTPVYDEILNYSGGLAPVRKSSAWGFVNSSGREVVKTEYEEIFGFSKGLAGVKKNGKWGFINTSGKIIVPTNYDVVTDYADGLAGVRKNGKWGFVNTSGSETIKCDFDNAWSFKDGMAGVENNGKWGFINKSGKTVIDLKYSQVNNFSEGLALVEKNGKYGFIDKSGNEVIEFLYTAAKPFKGGTARVFDGQKWLYISKSGKCVRDCN